MSRGQTQVFSFFYTVEAQFFCPRDKPSLSLGTIPGTKGGRKVDVLKVYMPFSLAINRCDLN